MPEYDVSFSSSSSTEGGSFKLLELPKDLCNLIENAIQSDDPLRQATATYIAHHSNFETHNTLLSSLKVKGQANEDAVLCTNDKTFSMRSVVLSNSILVVTSPPDMSSSEFSNDAVVIHDQVSEIMEITPSVPKLHKLSTLLGGREYDEGHDNDSVPENHEVRPVIHIIVKGISTQQCRKRLSYEDIQAEIQASDDELDRALKDQHILNISGKQCVPQ
jgi:sister chromatid cohesion protein DCC1